MAPRPRRAAGPRGLPARLAAGAVGAATVTIQASVAGGAAAAASWFESLGAVELTVSGGALANPRAYEARLKADFLLYMAIRQLVKPGAGARPLILKAEFDLTAAGPSMADSFCYVGRG